jgi:hypothetical protein
VTISLGPSAVSNMPVKNRSASMLRALVTTLALSATTAAG